MLPASPHPIPTQGASTAWPLEVPSGPFSFLSRGHVVGTQRLPNASLERDLRG